MKIKHYRGLLIPNIRYREPGSCQSIPKTSKMSVYTPWTKRTAQPLQACSKFQVRVCASGGPARCVTPRCEMNAWMNHTHSPPGPPVTCIGQNNDANHHKCTSNAHDMGGQAWCPPGWTHYTQRVGGGVPGMPGLPSTQNTTCLSSTMSRN